MQEARGSGRAWGSGRGGGGRMGESATLPVHLLLNCLKKTFLSHTAFILLSKWPIAFKVLQAFNAAVGISSGANRLWRFSD